MPTTKRDFVATVRFNVQAENRAEAMALVHLLLNMGSGTIVHGDTVQARVNDAATVGGPIQNTCRGHHADSE